MPTTPAINAKVTITSKSLLGDSVAKTFNAVSDLRFDYTKGVVCVTDVTGQFYFPLIPATTVTYTVVAGVNGLTTVVIS